MISKINFVIIVGYILSLLFNFLSSSSPTCDIEQFKTAELTAELSPISHARDGITKF